MSILDSTPYSRSNNPFRIYESTTPTPFVSTLRPAVSRTRVLRPWWRQWQREGFIATVVAIVMIIIALMPRPVFHSPLSSILSPLYIPVVQPKENMITTLPSSKARWFFRALKDIHVSSPFGARWGRRHQGVDFSAPSGTPIYAVASGKVVYSGWESGYGRTLILEHRPGFRTRYAHCRQLLATVGQRVRSGSLIAQVGSTGHSTGPHLHFEVIVNGIHRNPLRYYRLTAQSSDFHSQEPIHQQWLRSVGDVMKLWRHS